MTLLAVLAAFAPCHYQGVLPDPNCTPGAVEYASTRQVCTPGYSAAHRDVRSWQRRVIFARYGIEWARRGTYTLDHLIPVELAGSSDSLNLFPQPDTLALKKDRIENRLHWQVCRGRLSLRVAQQAIARNWVLA